ncbi:MAG: gliding motility-associated C-terminal domain-containing protein [Flavobacteriales bacterium]
MLIPNVFSPNGDGVNDKLVVTCNNCSSVEVRIFSASNNALVFKAHDLEHAWDGTMPNGQVEDGYYFYAIETTGPDGRTRSKGEVVRLFRP